MRKRKEQISQEKKLFSNKQLMIISIILVAIISLGLVLFDVLLQNQEAKFSFKAAIVDQLGKDFQSSEFNETGVVVNILTNAGFNVSYHRSETIDVAFYRGLARYNYGIIILRVHSATREGESIVDFFTSEEFRVDKYVSEQDDGFLTRGYYLWEPEKSYFAVTPKFVGNLEGCFPKSIIIAMGCNSLNETCTEMAEAFINKGAKAYIGWTGLVQLSHTDNETVRLLSKFLPENETLSGAVNALDRDPSYGSRMKYYPLEACNLTISELIAEATAPVNFQVTSNIFKPLLMTHGTTVINYESKDLRPKLD